MLLMLLNSSAVRGYKLQQFTDLVLISGRPLDKQYVLSHKSGNLFSKYVNSPAFFPLKIECYSSHLRQKRKFAETKAQPKENPELNEGHKWTLSSNLLTTIHYEN